MENNRIRFPDNKRERIFSGIITFFISGILLFFILTYKTIFTTSTPPTYIDINFEMDDLGANYGTDEVGLGEEEPADQEVLLGEGGSLLAGNIENIPTSVSEQRENNSFFSNADSKENISIPTKKTEIKKNTISTKQNSASSSQSTSNKSNSKFSTGNKNSKENPKGNAAVDNLLKGKGGSTTSTGQGTGGRPGQNQGVETGGSGSGGVGIGNGRKLTNFIPGTMGKKGEVPVHNCNSSGTIVFSYTVDKNGAIISVTRKSGVSNTCLVNTGIQWIKQYVKANKGTRSASGTYRINF
jgi:hypothetical protein